MNRRARRLPFFYAREELMNITDAIGESKLMVAFTLALFCGLRIGEICKLKFEDIDLVKRN